MPFVRVDGVRLYYEIHGDGVPLLLIAGLGSDVRSWLPVMEPLAARFRCVVFDNRGVGRSDTPPPPYSIRRMADDVAALLDRIGVSRPHVLAHSMGGYIAQEFAIAHPDRVDKLVLSGTSPVSSARNDLLFAAFHAALARGVPRDAWAGDFLFWLLSPACFRDAGFIETLVREAAEDQFPQSPCGFLGQIEAIAGFDSRGRLEKIRAETLVVHGERDILMPPEGAELLVGEIPGAAPLVTLKGAGHSVQTEAPEALVDAVVKFL